MTGRRGWTIAAVLVLALAGAGALFVPPIPQDPAYHRFADDRALLGVPNALNVLSNMPFTVVGILGLAAWLGARRGSFVHPSERRAYIAFFVGVGFTGLGSAYYHLAPDNDRLVWDRVPMTLAFMGLLAAVVTERVGVRAGTRLLLPFLAIGAGSVIYWQLTERAGAGDLPAVRPGAVPAAPRRAAPDGTLSPAVHAGHRPPVCHCALRDREAPGVGRTPWSSGWVTSRAATPSST